MKKIIIKAYCLFAVFTMNNLYSQITITQAEFPFNTMNFNALSDTTNGKTGITPGNGGVNQTWNFSTYTVGIASTFTTDYSSLNPNPNFPTANTTACTGTNYGGGNIMQNCMYIDINSSGIYYLGGVLSFTSATNQNSLTKYSPLIKMWSFPLTFLTSDSTSCIQTSETSYSPPPGYDSTFNRRFIKRKFEADGWGTVITPLGTYNSLRVKITEIVYSDSTWKHVVGTGWNFQSKSNPSTRVYYNWLSNVFNATVAVISPGVNGWQYNFYNPQTPTGINAIENKNDVIISPNPASDNISINQIPFNSKIKIYDVSGKMIYNSVSKDNVIETINTSDFSNGIYTIRIENNSEIINKKFIIQK